MITVDEAIEQANAILPHVAASDGELDLRWQAIIGVGEFVASDPWPVWAFVLRWGASDDNDLRAAVATCVLEHLLEHHFDMLFPQVEMAAVGNPQFADCFVQCWPLGEAEHPQNLQRFAALKARLAAI